MGRWNALEVGGLLTIAYLMAGGAVVRGQVGAGEAPAEPGLIQFGLEQRVRTEDWNNIQDYSDRTDDEREQIRYRTRVWAIVPVRSNIVVNVGLTQETFQKFGKVNKLDEVVFDTANIEFKHLFDQGLSLKIGRQNLMRGEGFLLFDGNSGDGSRTQYFNAVDLGYDFWKSRLDAIAILNPSKDRFLPRFNDQSKAMQDWDEQAVGLYYTDQNLRKTRFEAYYFYKKEIRDTLAPSNPQFQPDRHVNTAGGRVVQQLTTNWSATGEFASQWGAQHPNRKISASGGYGYVRRTFAHPWKPYAQTGYWALSGDDPKTGAIEGWDPLFSRWPKWSDLYVYSQIKENAVAYWTNLRMWQAEVGFRPIPRIQSRLTYYHMSAAHPFPGSQSYFANGLGRGNLFQAFAELRLNKHWKGHALWEGMGPGDFYRTRDRGYFVRFDVSYQFNFDVAVTKAARKGTTTGGSAKPARSSS